jgi:hypothetical protein
VRSLKPRWRGAFPGVGHEGKAIAVLHRVLSTWSANVASSWSWKRPDKCGKINVYAFKPRISTNVYSLEKNDRWSTLGTHGNSELPTDPSALIHKHGRADRMAVQFRRETRFGSHRKLGFRPAHPKPPKGQSHRTDRVLPKPAISCATDR